jgi:hypothetical protein
MLPGFLWVENQSIQYQTGHLGETTNITSEIFHLHLPVMMSQDKVAHSRCNTAVHYGSNTVPFSQIIQAHINLFRGNAFFFPSGQIRQYLYPA